MNENITSPFGTIRTPGTPKTTRSFGIFNYFINFIFLIGIACYIYELVLDSEDNSYRPLNETIWIWGMFILLIFGFFASSSY
jgi:hypothetical protein